jgi:hypothetical protein
MIEMLLLTSSLVPLNSTNEISLNTILFIRIPLSSHRIRWSRTRSRLLRHFRFKILFRLFIFSLSLTWNFRRSVHHWFLIDNLCNILKSIKWLVKFFNTSLEIRWIIALWIKSWRMRDRFIMPWIKMTVFREFANFMFL